MKLDELYRLVSSRSDFVGIAITEVKQSGSTIAGAKILVCFKRHESTFLGVTLKEAAEEAVTALSGAARPKPANKVLRLITNGAKGDNDA